MRITYNAYTAGSIEIDDSELEGKTKDEIEIYINDLVGAQLEEEIADHMEWEIDEE